MCPCIRVGVDKGGHYTGHFQPHAVVGEDQAPGQGNLLHQYVEEGEGEEDDHQAEVQVVERVLELAQVAPLLNHPQSHLPTFQLILSGPQMRSLSPLAIWLFSETQIKSQSGEK